MANRNRIIKKNFGIEIKRAATASFYEELDYAVDSSDDSYDVAMASIRDGMNLAVRSRLVDFNTANYIDFTQAWWNQGIAENLSLAGGTYLAIGDLCTVDKEATWCVLFNADILATKNKGLSESELHRIVKSGIGCHGGWTLEYLMVVAQLHGTAENDPEKNIWDPGYQGTGNHSEYYSSLLRGKATPEDDIRQMLDIVFENRIYDFSLSLNIRNINEAIENSVSDPSFEWMPYKVSLLGNFDEAVKNTLNGVL